MSTVSQREWLRRATGEEEREQLDENLGQHAQETSVKQVAVRQARTRSLKRRVPPGPPREHGSNIPRYPDPLPGAPWHLDHAAEAILLADNRTQTLDVGPAQSAYDGMNAHGVTSEIHWGGRVAPNPTQRGPGEANKIPDLTPLPQRPPPIPVYVVQEGGGTDPLLRCSFRRMQCAESGLQPTQIANKNPKRSQISFLNEDQTNGLYLLNDPTDASGGAGGAYLPPKMTDYITIQDQDAIFAISAAAATVYLSIIDEYSVPGGA